MTTDNLCANPHCLLSIHKGGKFKKDQFLNIAKEFTATTSAGRQAVEGVHLVFLSLSDNYLLRNP